MTTIDDVTNTILAGVLQSTTLEHALYREGDKPLGVDVYREEFDNPNQPWAPTQPSPLMADVPGADTSNWSDAPRPTRTAWKSANIDAYYLDGVTWRHCQTGEEWEGNPVNLLDAVRAAREGSDYQMEAAQ